jgi:GNAT superfamily N-acetyltransferase
MNVWVQEIGVDGLSLYDAIPSWFEVRSVLRVVAVDGGLGGFRLVEETIPQPYVKRYDDDDEDRPSRWAASFDLSRWGIFLAREGERVLGGAAVALDTAVYPMDRFQRKDLAVLWDIRVHPDAQRRRIGTMLFRHAADWARRQGCGQLGLETQSVNVPACRFYAYQGCELGAIHRFGYAGCRDVAHEAMLLWYLNLEGARV